MTTPPDDLSEKEREVLIAAWSGKGQSQGLIILTTTIGASYLIAGHQQFNFHDNNRLSAEYEESVQNLVSKGLVKYSQGAGYALTAAGYRLGDHYAVGSE
ncbi:MAG: hypothetical protein OXE87_16705 [Chloroflexi bacterium]|nr:hypothetical protein [Chloroflexota bacterium]